MDIPDGKKRRVVGSVDVPSQLEGVLLIVLWVNPMSTILLRYSTLFFFFVDF